MPHLSGSFIAEIVKGRLSLLCLMCYLQFEQHRKQNEKQIQLLWLHFNTSKAINQIIQGLLLYTWEFFLTSKLGANYLYIIHMVPIKIVIRDLIFFFYTAFL